MSRKLTGFIVVAGHLDIEWYQPLRSYRFWTIDTFEDLKKAAKREDFTSYILDGQVFPLEEYLEVVPEDEGEIRELIKKGKLVIGPFYTQFDEWLPSAENMIRNCLYGKRKAESFGSYMRAGYLPDNFGHPLQLPQILRGFGIDSLLFMRGLPEIPGGHPDEFIYRGLDGSEVLVSHFRESYSGAFDIFAKKIDPIQPRIVPYYDGDDSYLSFEWHRELADHDDPERIAKSMISNVQRIKDRYPSGVIPLISGFDHLPPQINIGDSVKAANESQNEIEFVMGNAEEYIRLVYERQSNPAVYNMELLGSRYQYVLLGALSTRCYLKRENFAGEAMIERYAEPLDVLASLSGYPKRSSLFDEAWKHLMTNSAHDSIHGSSVDEVHIEMQYRNAAVRQIAAGLIHDALGWMGRRIIDRFWERLEGKDSKGIVSYAPVNADFAQPAELWLPIGEDPGVICDSRGNYLLTQVLSREPIELNGLGEARNDPNPAGVFRRVLFMDKFDAYAINTHALVMNQVSETETDLKAGNDFIENEFIRVEINGALLNLYDKKQEKWYANLNLLEEEADAGDAWDFSPPWITGETVRSSRGQFHCKLIENGPVRSVLNINGVMNVPAGLEGDVRSEKRVDIPVSFSIMVYSSVARVDVKLTLDNTAKDHRIRLRLAPNIKTGFIRSQGHLAIIDRKVERQTEIEKWNQSVTRLLPFREWVSVQDEKHGLCVAVKGIYDYEAVENTLTGCPEVYLTLLRGFALMGRLHTMQRWGGASPSVAVPGAQCPGVQNFEWSYVPYAAAENEKAPFLKAVQSFLYPPVSHAVRSKPESETKKGVGGIAWHEDNIQFSAFKRSLDGNGYILRFFENQGKETNAKISIPDFSGAFLSDLDERNGEKIELNSKSISLNVKPYKVITLRLVK